jgi:hypothetical protein
MGKIVRKTETFVQLHRDLLLSKIFRIVDKNTDYKPDLEDDLAFDPRLKKFVPVKIRRRKSETISYGYESGGQKYAFRFSCHEILNEDDARVLCAIGALASAKLGKPLSMDDPSEETKAALGELGHVGVKINPEKNRVPYRVETSHSEILNSLGLSIGGSNQEAIRRSIDRLSKVHVKIEIYDTARETLSELSFNLMTYAQLTNVKSGQSTLAVVFNAVTAQALLGSMDGTIYMRLSELEELASKTAGAKLLHFRLCAQIKPGAAENFYANTLAGYLWKDCDLSLLSRDARRDKMKLLAKALKDLMDLGWTSVKVDLKYGLGWKICRPAAPGAIEAKLVVE